MSRKKAHNSMFLSFANNIQKLIDDYCGGDKKDFAEKINVHYDTVRRWCNGNNLPEGADLLIIHQKFGVSLDWLLTGKEPGAKFMHTWPENIVRACRDLKEIMESDEPVILPALQTGLAAFRESVSRKADNDALKKRLDSIEKKLKHMEKLKDDSLGGGSGID